MYDGEKRPLPCFHGVRGPEVVRSLLEIEATFEKNLQILKDVKKTILDVKVNNMQCKYIVWDSKVRVTTSSNTTS